MIQKLRKLLRIIILFLDSLIKDAEINLKKTMELHQELLDILLRVYPEPFPVVFEESDESTNSVGGKLGQLEMLTREMRRVLADLENLKNNYEILL
jgi:hypothetical protein